MNLPKIGAAIPIIEAKQKRCKAKVSPHLLPMFATICPIPIVGSAESDADGMVVLILESDDLPDAEFVTIHCENNGLMSLVTIAPINA